jgi:hypothetical protein
MPIGQEVRIIARPSSSFRSDRFNFVGPRGERLSGDEASIPGPKKTKVIVKECEYVTYFAVLYYVSFQFCSRKRILPTSL